METFTNKNRKTDIERILLEISVFFLKNEKIQKQIKKQGNKKIERFFLYCEKYYKTISQQTNELTN